MISEDEYMSSQTGSISGQNIQYTVTHNSNHNRKSTKTSNHTTTTNNETSDNNEWVWHDHMKGSVTKPKLVQTRNIYQKKKTPFDNMVTKMSFL
jgi:hypothetical protein